MVFTLKARSKSANSTRKCPPGEIRRKAYVRKYSTGVRERGFTVRRKGQSYRAYPRSGSMIVKSACVKDKGLPGKGPDLFGKLKKGELKKYGYVYRQTREARHSALRRAVKEYGPLDLFRKLDAVAKLTRRTVPEASRVFKSDREWVRQVLGPLKS